jgi:hypothetical protein
MPKKSGANGWSTVYRHNAFAASWVNVGYWYHHADKLNSFQVILIDRTDRAIGDYDVEFNET